MVDLLLTIPKNNTINLKICKRYCHVIIGLAMKSPIVRIVLFCFGIALVVGAVGYGSVKLYGQLQSGRANASTCHSKGINHLATIKNGTVNPTHISGRLCDTLTITNTDDVLRFIAFGLHEEHEPYDGVSEKTIGQGQSFTVTLNQTGSFKFHDHLHDEVAGTFTVQ